MSQELVVSGSPTEILNKSTATGSNGTDDSVILEAQEVVIPIYDTAAALEAQLEQLKTERKQERFVWLLAVTGLIDALLFQALPWYGAIFAVLFSVILLLVAARICEVPWIVTHLERIFDRASGSRQSE